MTFEQWKQPTAIQVLGWAPERSEEKMARRNQEELIAAQALQNSTDEKARLRAEVAALRAQIAGARMCECWHVDQYSDGLAHFDPNCPHCHGQGVRFGDGGDRPGPEDQKDKAARG